MHQIMTKFLFLTVTTLFLSSCATTSLVDTWRNPSLPVLKPHKVLVVGIFKNSDNRRVYEDIIANELNLHKVEAIPSHTLVPVEIKMGQQALKEAEKESGAEAVLTIQTIKVEHQTIVQPGYATPLYPDYWYPGAFPSWDLNGYYGSMLYNEPTYISSFEEAKIQANLFDTRSGKLLWAATISTSEPRNIVSVSKDLAAIIVRSLVAEGLI